MVITFICEPASFPQFFYGFFLYSRDAFILFSLLSDNGFLILFIATTVDITPQTMKKILQPLCINVSMKKA